MYSTSFPYPREAIGDDMNPLLPAKDPEPHVAPATLCARKVMVFPDTKPVPRPGVTGQPYVRLLARVSGLVQDLPPGMVFDGCLVPGGVPPEVELEDAADPVIQTGVAIPNEQIGKQDAPLMAEPTAGFKTITVDGVAVTVADYSGDVA
jgi:hypothetical protein